MFRLSSEVGHRISVSDTILAACKIANANFDEALKETETSE
jgi:hypothetical protein